MSCIGREREQAELVAALDHGYLIDQFLRDGTNHRRDRCGGSIEGRVRFLLEVTEAAAQAWSVDRVGIRLSPTIGHLRADDSDPLRHFAHVADVLSPIAPAYLHLVAPEFEDPESLDRAIIVEMRRRFDGRGILNGGLDSTVPTKR